MIRLQEGALQRYVFASFPQDGLIHGLFNRRGGYSRGPFASLNVGQGVQDDPQHVAANHRAIYSALHIEAEDVVSAQQVHGARVALATAEDGGRTLEKADALISNTPGIVLMMRVADCVPIFFHSVQPAAVGLAHAGWRGTLKGVAGDTVRAMVSAFDCQPDELIVGLGPSIGPCCYEVGPEVVAQVREVFGAQTDCLLTPSGEGKAYFDLWRANELQLEKAGVEQVETAGICTCCHRDEFYSHRGDGKRTGRLAALIGLVKE
ncbi:MAG: peptidoglycan editing factor PgeF [Chloroflexota bacterium]|nr:peptidoglycan editing factor PgeF [Chloroflexota bacterium]